MILKKIDSNGSGTVDYSEFIMACSNVNDILTNENLLAAFKVFDADNSNSITFKEIISVLGLSYEKNQSEIEEFKRILEDIDLDGNGEISFEEFKVMMKKLLLK
jgi:calcium-dependent protein kinase